MVKNLGPPPSCVTRALVVRWRWHESTLGRQLIPRIRLTIKLRWQQRVRNEGRSLEGSWLAICPRRSTLMILRVKPMSGVNLRTTISTAGGMAHSEAEGHESPMDTESILPASTSKDSRSPGGGGSLTSEGALLEGYCWTIQPTWASSTTGGRCVCRLRGGTTRPGSRQSFGIAKLGFRP